MLKMPEITDNYYIENEITITYYVTMLQMQAGVNLPH